MNRLVLIDGHAIIHRAYHALPPLTTSYGQPGQAAYGFVSMLLRVIDELKPTHLAVCFDLPEATFRHTAYIAYQAHRPTADQDLVDQIIMVHELVHSSGIPVYTAAGFEADDVIGTLAREAVEDGIDEVIIVTGDKDIMQLVCDNVGNGRSIKVYAPVRGFANGKVFDEKEVFQYVGVLPSKIVDYKALMGDSSDNYPGVPGIGPKTAVGLLEKYSTLEEIYKNVRGKTEKVKSLPESVIKKLELGEESAFLSKHLATIVTDAPVELDLEKAKVHPLREDRDFVEKLKELGFKSLLTRIGGALEGKTKTEKPKTDRKNDNQMELL
ncbi:MAG: hypothetical protein A2700_02770 [Candidatus Blackburnbacteria bacterium RIFCSPHIGHO2_01_FULL_44_64]|uniref:5'-3' exonuclease domain-containing protein n=1 Tax=Candidatus Blackburnbacteria bacterium RIFCSPHIGHO2_02_FULL_44_20 TaxID=1797516 RepID=A0A1G1V427_9BACT|nr:MAG: hypothetical protein A2700_02770 [Candidatus Blackburnbacteria bacterium RIFCSPHIGHO2_01_FULL_44_64]OGY10119.1 MAG: hypothetical protein A3D26_00840 [Candidatus Blackburnbacteria bacterium RIFCSPHIGHO2_02_FULL_44_20]OGY10629.1 MAG: hypothetical protein A3E16_02295 [Candidatus Blackburnbacteria bacterium RIFCSPHIGHO2_12_FULL_44_25]OGY15318.1 MAG: hypothetical protein A3A62_01530 [Candidatus Blackburnbacteria bacterium RIFCSPLOWO2_01_FULL_44_43]OGY15469.1 MAG: hypothetical protein A3H88_0